MSGIVIIVLILAVGLYLRFLFSRKLVRLINTLDDLEMDLEAAIRSNNIEKVEKIACQIDDTRKSFPFVARFGDFKSYHNEFVNRYNRICGQIDNVYREIEIQRRMNQ